MVKRVALVLQEGTIFRLIVQMVYPGNHTKVCIVIQAAHNQKWSKAVPNNEKHLITVKLYNFGTLPDRKVVSESTQGTSEY